jgi:hypothetical protein
MLSATSFTCFSVAGFVGSFPGAVLLLGNTGSEVKVFTHHIVWFVVLSTRFDKSTISAIGSQPVPFHTTLVPASNFGAEV